MPRKNIHQKQKQSVNVKIHIDNSNRKKSKRTKRAKRKETSNQQQPILYPQVLYINSNLPPLQQQSEPAMQIKVPQSLAQTIETPAKEPVAIEDTSYFQPVEEPPLQTPFTPTFATALQSKPDELPLISPSNYIAENSMSRISQISNIIPDDDTIASLKPIKNTIKGKKWIKMDGVRFPRDPDYMPPVGRLWNQITGREVSIDYAGKDFEEIVEFNAMNNFI